MREPLEPAEVLASGFLAALAAAACVGAVRIGLGDVHAPGPGLLPFGTAALLGVMAPSRLVAAAVTGGGEGAAFATSRWRVVAVVLGALARFGVLIERAGFTIENATVLIVTAPRGLPRHVAERLEKASVEAAKTEPYLSTARKNEVILGEPLTGQAPQDAMKTLSGRYEALIRDAGLYRSEKK